MNFWVEVQPVPPYSLGQFGQSQPGRLAPAADHADVEPRVVGDQVVAVGEGEQVIQLIGPASGFRDHVGGDAVDRDVPRCELVVARGRPDQPAGLVHDATVTHLDEADGARAGT